MQEMPALETIGARLAWVRYLAREGDAPNSPPFPAVTLSRLAGLGDSTVNGIENARDGRGANSETVTALAVVLAPRSRVAAVAAWLAFGAGDVPEREDVRRAVQRAQRAGAAS